MSKLVNVKDNFHEEVYESEIPVFVDFWTEGCGPCEGMIPLLEELAERYEGKIKFGKFYVTIEDAVEKKNEIVTKYDVMGFPTFMVFKDGEPVKTHIGMFSEDEFTELVKDVL